MGASRHKGPASRYVSLCCLAMACSTGPVLAATRTKASTDPWQSALNARALFESEPSGTHTEAGYVRLMNAFRAIYHGDPSDAHAPRAVQQVAELLAEQGRELRDRKSLHDAARQYEFLADQYPSSTLAPEALGHALELLGPQAGNDPSELSRVQIELGAKYPKYAHYVADHRDAIPSQPILTPVKRAAANQPSTSGQSANDAAGPQPVEEAPSKTRAIADATVEPTIPSHGPIAEVTGIRHWSTSTYTRVAIDLGDEVQYQAARVENPDRIFFDLHHAHLAPQLAGKSFVVTDDGFLTKIRAAQFSGDVTRVVLDVHEVTEYSAFLLPNPYRLIIDIHGKRSAEGKTSEPLAGNSNQQTSTKEYAGTSGDEPAQPASPTVPTPATADHYVPPSRRSVYPANSTQVAESPAGLPPMPVTDGSAAFGLTPRREDKSTNATVVAPPRVVIPAKPTASKPVPNTVTAHTSDAGVAVAAVSRQPGKVDATSAPTSQPIAERSKTPRSVPHVNGSPAQAAPPTADGETSLVRALGLKIGRIVIDAGHGGHDSGTLGVDDIEEKDVVLDVALRLGKLLHDRLGAEIVYTRADDTFIPLETRTAIANKAQADLFISVHANSSPDETARGVEVYYLNFTSDPDAMRVASRENAVSTQSVHELSDLVKKIALKDKIEESRELATDVDDSLYRGLAKGNDGLKNRGVKKAPFVVLIGANMPSILAEISFVTNATDAEKLNRPDYRQRVAESLYGGVAKYAATINGQGTPLQRANASPHQQSGATFQPLR